MAVVIMLVTPSIPPPTIKATPSSPIALENAIKYVVSGIGRDSLKIRGMAADFGAPNDSTSSLKSRQRLSMDGM